MYLTLGKRKDEYFEYVFQTVFRLNSIRLASLISFNILILQYRITIGKLLTENCFWLLITFQLYQGKLDKSTKYLYGPVFSASIKLYRSVHPVLMIQHSSKIKRN